jgi:hypothetical protein
MAEPGMRLCAWCWQRLATDVAAAPTLVAHLREIGKPYAQTAPPADTRSWRDPAETPLRPAAWDAADDIHAILAAYAHLVLEEHPLGSRMTGPDETRVILTSTVKHLDPDVFPPLPGEPTAWIRPPEVAGLVTPDATVRLVTWLTPQLPWCATRPWAAVMRREIATTVASTTARWPTADIIEGEHRVPMPCPSCDQRTLTYTPPSWAHSPFKASCSNPDCARVWSEDEWEWLLTMATKGTRRSA